MTWEAAMRWARIRARETYPRRYRVCGYISPINGRWSYMVRRAE